MRRLGTRNQLIACFFSFSCVPRPQRRTSLGNVFPGFKNNGIVEIKKNLFYRSWWCCASHDDGGLPSMHKAYWSQVWYLRFTPEKNEFVFIYHFSSFYFSASPEHVKDPRGMGRGHGAVSISMWIDYRSAICLFFFSWKHILGGYERVIFIQ